MWENETLGRVIFDRDLRCLRMMEDHKQSLGISGRMLGGRAIREGPYRAQEGLSHIGTTRIERLKRNRLL